MASSVWNSEYVGPRGTISTDDPVAMAPASKHLLTLGDHSSNAFNVRART